VTAFNGKGKQLILFTYNSLSGAQTIVGNFGPPSGAGSAYGTTLTTQIPPLAGGTAVIQEFNTRLAKRTFKYKGKKASYVSSSCKDKKIQFQARFTDTQGQVATGTSTQKCKQKK